MLDFAKSAYPHERMINLGKLEVLSETILVVPQNELVHDYSLINNPAPIDIKCLHVNRIKEEN